MKKGVRMFGDEGIATIYREMIQFNDRNVVRPLKKIEITPEIKSKALGYLMFLKQKQTGETKGRGCADGRPQRIYKTKPETSSPTACTESIFINSAIDAKERCKVAICDIPGAFLKTEASDGTIIKLQGTLVDTLAKINPEWKEHIIYEGK